MLKEILIAGLLAPTICIWICGCASVHPTPVATATPTKPTKIEIRNNAASLLDDLLNDEQNVDKVLIIKHASPDTASLIKLIAATAATHKRELDEMATNDPSLDLQVMDLPPGEMAARDATASSKKHDLLFTSGNRFEFNLLYTQAEAESYGWHLAAVAAKNSENPDEARTFETISQTMERLYGQVIIAMRAVPTD